MKTILLFSVALFSLPLLAEEPEAKTNLSVRLETFSMPLADAASLIRQGSDDPKLYEASITRTEAGTAKQESLTVLRCRSGEKTLNESLLETIYPTEYEPAEIPNSISIADSKDAEPGVPASAIGQLRDLVTPATPTSFETRNLGITAEIEATFHQDAGLATLRIAPDWVRLVGRSAYGEGVSKLEMPEIESQRLTTAVVVRLDKPFLLGTLNRSPESTVDPQAATRVWFAFVTVSKVEP
jgi:hypothetical protein